MSQSSVENVKSIGRVYGNAGMSVSATTYGTSTCGSSQATKVHTNTGRSVDRSIFAPHNVPVPLAVPRLPNPVPSPPFQVQYPDASSSTNSSVRPLISFGNLVVSFSLLEKISTPCTFGIDPLSKYGCKRMEGVYP